MKLHREMMKRRLCKLQDSMAVCLSPSAAVWDV